MGREIPTLLCSVLVVLLLSCSQKEPSADDGSSPEGEQCSTSTQAPLKEHEIEDLVWEVCNGDEESREEARNKLKKAGTHALSVLNRQLKSENSREKRAVLYSLKLAIEWDAAMQKMENATIDHGENGPAGLARTEWEKLLPSSLSDIARTRILDKLFSSKPRDVGNAIDDIGNDARRNEEMLPSLRRLLRHREWWVRAKSASWLGRVGDSGSLSELQRLLSDTRNEVKISAIEAIEMIGDRDMVPVLIALLKEEDELVRLAAVKVIGALGGAEVVSNLKTCLNDPSESVRTEATIILARFREQEVVKDILERLSKPKAYGLGATTRAFDVMNNYAFPEVYENLSTSKIGRKVSGENWVECYSRFVNQEYSGIRICLDVDIRTSNWVVARGITFGTKFEFPAETTLREALLNITTWTEDRGVGTRLAYLIQEDGSVLIVSRQKAQNYWNDWYKKQYKLNGQQ